MEQTAACITNSRSDGFGLRVCGASGSSLWSCSPPTAGSQTTWQCLKSSRFPTLSCDSAGYEYSPAGDSQSNLGVSSRRRPVRSVHSRASSSNGSSGGSDLPAGSCIDQVRAMHAISDHNLRPYGRLDSRVGGDHTGRGVDRQVASPIGISNAVVQVDKARRSSGSNPMILTTEDSLRRPSSFGATEVDVASQKSLVLPDTASKESKQLCVAVDVDEVLGSFLSTLNLFIKETYSLHHDLSEYYIYDFMKVWNCSQTEANRRVHAFFESDHFKNGIIPIPGAHQTLLQLAVYCQLVVVTSRQHIIREPTLEWIDRYYSGIFKEVHFGNHFALEGSAKPKSEICRSLGAQILIDDNPRYALDCAECGIEVLLFDLHGGYPWSKTPCGPQHPLITRVRNWQEVERALLVRTCARL